MKKIIYVLIFGVLQTVNFYGQNQWQRIIGGSLYENANSVAGTNDGGCVCTGTTYSFGAGSQDVYVVKLDAAGSLQWTKTFGGSYLDESSSIVQTSDSGYILTAFFNSPGINVLKLNSSGDLQWSENISGLPVAYSIIETSDGGYAIGGFTNNEDFCLIKLNSVGSVQWNKAIGGNNTDECESIIQTSDGGYALAGFTTSFGAGLEDVYVVKLNASGEFQWNCTVGSANSDIGWSIIQTSDGGYAVAGSDGGSMYIIKLNADGTLQWTRATGGAGTHESIIQTSDGGYVVSGSYQLNMYIVKLASTGTVQWGKTIGTTAEDRAYSLAKALDGGYFLAGYSDFNGDQTDIYVVKFDSNWTTCGNLNSASNTFSPAGVWGNPNSNSYSASLSTSIITPSVSSGGTVMNICTSGPQLYSVSGTVRYQDNNQPVSTGYVKALSYNSQNQQITIVDSAAIQSNGTYILIHCPPIPLDIMAYENDEEEASFVPTYYVSTIYWENSTQVTPDSNLTGVDIGVYRINNINGNFHIGGGVYSAGSEDEAAMKDAIVYARIGNVFKGYSVSGNTGAYKIDSLSSGVYELICNRMGYYSGVRPFQLTTFSVDTIDFVLSILLVSVEPNLQNIPEKYWLSQNYPNPFNPQTKIKFGLPEQSYVKLILYDVLGREVGRLIDKDLKAGEYNVTWDASRLSSGIYFYRLETGNYIETKKMVLIK